MGNKKITIKFPRLKFPKIKTLKLLSINKSINESVAQDLCEQIRTKSYGKDPKAIEEAFDKIVEHLRSNPHGSEKDNNELADAVEQHREHIIQKPKVRQND